MPLTRHRASPASQSPQVSCSTAGKPPAGTFRMPRAEDLSSSTSPAAPMRAARRDEVPQSTPTSARTPLVVVARDEGAALAHQEVEVHAFVRLQHVVHV